MNPKIETEFEESEHAIENTNIQNYQLSRDKERRQIRPNPRNGLLHLTGLTLVSRKALEQAEPDSYEEAINGKISEN